MAGQLVGSGIGLIVAVKERQHYTVSIRKVADKWIAVVPPRSDVSA